jgi:hypothetical protein
VFKKIVYKLGVISGPYKKIVYKVGVISGPYKKISPLIAMQQDVCNK